MNLLGRQLGAYRLITELGSGGMGTVYYGEHVRIGRRAAVKVLDGDLAKDEDVVARFFAEARAVNAIRHPNIVDVVDLGCEEGLFYLVMELLEGETLGARLERVNKLSPSEVARLVREVARALTAVHDRGMVHRDLKPENVFLHRDEEGNEGVKVLDFGIVKLLDQPEKHKTRQGMLIGTPAYMSPEQCAGGALDARSDVYSLALVAYEALTGTRPFPHTHLLALLAAHQVDVPEPPHTRDPAVSELVSAVIMSALAKNPDVRPSTVRAFAEQFGDAVDGKVVGARSTQKLRDRKGPKVSQRAAQRLRNKRSLAPEEASHDAEKDERGHGKASRTPEKATPSAPKAAPAKQARPPALPATPVPPPVAKPPPLPNQRAANEAPPTEVRSRPLTQAVVHHPDPTVRRTQARNVGDRISEIVARRLDEGSLKIPAMPQACLACLELVRSPQVSYPTIASEASRDPVLASRLLQAANSVLLGARQRITELDVAILRLGLDRLRALLVEQAARRVFVSRDPALRGHVQRIWERSQRVGELASALTPELSAPFSRGTAQMAGLVRDIGQPVLAGLLVDVERTLDRELLPGSWLSEEVFLSVVAKHARAVGVAVVRHWELPAEIAATVAADDAWEPHGITLVNLVRHVTALVDGAEEAELNEGRARLSLPEWTERRVVEAVGKALPAPRAQAPSFHRRTALR